MRVRDPVWLSDFRINARMVDRFRDRRVFVAGDAAHIHSPLGGQGIATGIQDASNLAWKLFAALREGAPDSLLDTFDEERKPIARTVLRETSAASNLVFSDESGAPFCPGADRLSDPADGVCSTLALRQSVTARSPISQQPGSA